MMENPKDAPPKSALQLDRAALMPQRVTVRITRDVAFNFDKLTQITKTVN